jgi:hypothetical protein
MSRTNKSRVAAALHLKISMRLEHECHQLQENPGVYF